MNQEDRYTNEYIKEISEEIDSRKEYYAEISNKIWEFAEPRFQEYKSSELLQHALKKKDFLLNPIWQVRKLHLLQNMDLENQL